MSGTREVILMSLLNHPKATIDDLAGSAGINVISVRHHITNLLADGLIQIEEQRHGVGRPRMIYSLTEKGMEKFPTSYLKFTNHLLEQIQDVLPAATINTLFDRVATQIVSDYKDKVKNLSMDERFAILQKLLKDEGFLIEWKKASGVYEIQEVSCPYHQISQKHPEICTIDQSVISKLLDIPVNRITCILTGDQHCTYIIPAPDRSDL